MKTASLLLVASASCSYVSAHVALPFHRVKEADEGTRKLVEGDVITFDPPIPVTSYVGDSCTDDVEKFAGKVQSIEMVGEGEFCITELVNGEEAYTLLDQITCTPWGVFDRYNTCTDSTCTDCVSSAVSYYPWMEAVDSAEDLDGYCFDYTYSFDPTSFTDLISINFKFDDGANMLDAARYMGIVAMNSCIMDGPEGAEETAGEDDEVYVGDDEVADDDDDECLSIPDLLCSLAGFQVLCDFFTVWAPELYEPASTEILTLFAPPDLAFASVAAGIESLTDEEAGEVFLFHATMGAITEEDIECGGLAEMMSGGMSRTVCTDDGLGIKGGGNRKNNNLPLITEGNIAACNGVVHIISEVMLPNFIDEF